MPKTAQMPWALVDRTDLVPLCPYCEEPLNEVYRRGRGFPLGEGRTLVYFCPQCLKVLGFAQGRVF
jgi:ribosomal protein L13E